MYIKIKARSSRRCIFVRIDITQDSEVESEVRETRSSKQTKTTSTRTSETDSVIDESGESTIESLYLTVLYLPFRLVKWFSVLLLLIPIGEF